MDLAALQKAICCQIYWRAGGSRELPGVGIAPSRSWGVDARSWRPEGLPSLLSSCPTGRGSAVWTRPEHWLLLKARTMHRAATIIPDAPFMPVHTWCLVGSDA